MKYRFQYKTLYIIAANYSLAAIMIFMIASCKKGDVDIELIDSQKVPQQVVVNMSVVQSDKGKIEMRTESRRMERYSYIVDSVKVSYDFFPLGFFVYMYTPEGELETQIKANQAKHITTKGKESWSAFGKVEVTNYIKGERMETDTIYWDQEKKKIYTNCYVKIISTDGMMQGYGMESDELGRNATILKPFNSYGIVEKDTTDFYLDTINLIGPRKI
ncbi:MAG: LPS export ABC transporter periplasmic protein LptC [Bacteroidales bacterium]|nr:LPS export ABC transporter periplasmic protein LptC [Bacteroidales bacterium]